MSMEVSNPHSPRVLSVDLALAAFELGEWRSDDDLEQRIGGYGGSSLAVALLAREARVHPDQEPPIVVAIGPAVTEGLPTAVRATIASRAPMTGAYADGQVGTDLGRRMASVCEGLLLRGRTELAGAVLHIRSGGTCELLTIPELEGAKPARIAEVLRQRFGECASLRIGPSARAGVRFASLIAGHSPPSLVGRGGLGYAFAQTGLVAVAISASLVPAGVRRKELDRLLLSSPRLALRAEGGTLELAQARAARGELTGRGGQNSISPDQAQRWSEQVDASKKGHHGCAGCPTPCGYVFENASGKRQGARFSAFDALGWNLGIDDPAQTLSLLSACDEWGIDAKETGAILATLARARAEGRSDGPELFGDFARLRATLELVASGQVAGALHGARELEHALGGVPGISPAAVHRIAERPETNLAQRLGTRVACRGAEPMRTHPFLVDGSVRGQRLEGLFAPFELPPGSDDPLDPRGKGRLVWWHENLTAAVDASGFCAFSAASLLADGVTTLDDLALALVPGLAASSQPGLDWLAAGAAALMLVRELNRTWGQAPEAWASGEVFAEPGMLPEYLAWRGLDHSGWPRADWREWAEASHLLDFGRGGPQQPGSASSIFSDSARAEVGARVAGHVRLRAFGSLGAKLGSEPLAFQLPCRLDALLEDLARDVPDAASSLIRAGEPLAAVYRTGERLRAGDLVRDGDVLDLVLATAGG